MRKTKKELFDVVSKIEKSFEKSTDITIFFVDAQTGELIKSNPASPIADSIEISIRI